MGKILQILTIPENEKTLRRKASDVSEKQIKEERMQQFCLDLAETMLEREGIGLAATQVGENIRLVAISEKDGTILMFNPKISKKSLLKNWDEEGCLSVPYVFGEVKRNNSVTCEYLNEKGEKKKIRASGLLARVIQHEIDHLDGILFIDKAKNLRKIDEAEIKKEEENG